MNYVILHRALLIFGALLCVLGAVIVSSVLQTVQADENFDADSSCLKFFRGAFIILSGMLLIIAAVIR